jgi:hypothetical protein
MTRERTHYNGCEFAHIECAEIVIQELRDIVATLEIRIQELERQLEQQAWTISPAMAQAKIDELNQALAAVENETGLHEERRQFNQKIAELQCENATLQQRYDMLQGETARCCDARLKAERAAVWMARLVQQERIVIWMDLFEADEVDDDRVQARLRMDDSYQDAKAIIDQYTTKEPRRSR